MSYLYALDQNNFIMDGYYAVNTFFLFTFVRLHAFICSTHFNCLKNEI